MPYWEKDEKRYDVDGREVRPGYILERVDCTPDMEPWRYHICYLGHSGKVEVRDMNANNVHMCNVAFTPDGEGADIRVLGYWMECLHLLDVDDLQYHFNVKPIAHGDEGLIAAIMLPGVKK